MHTTDVHHLTITRWNRPVAGEPITLADHYALLTVLPRLGPTASLVLQLSTYQFDHGTPAWRTTYDELGQQLGVGTRQMIATIERLIRLGYARWADDQCIHLEVAAEVAAQPVGEVRHIPTGDEGRRRIA